MRGIGKLLSEEDRIEQIKKEIAEAGAKLEEIAAHPPDFWTAELLVEAYEARKTRVTGLSALGETAASTREIEAMTTEEYAGLVIRTSGTREAEKVWAEYPKQLHAKYPRLATILKSACDDYHKRLAAKKN